MFFRVWLRSLAVKRPQSLLAFAALALGATVASLLLNLYGDAQRKMTSEFRAYGANVIAAPAGSGTGRPAGSSPGADAEGANPGLDRMPALEGAVGAPGGLMDAATAAALQSAVRVSGTGAPGILAVPVLYVVATAAPARDPATAGAAASLVAVGTDFAALHALNPAWKFTGSETATNRQAASEPGACVLGKRAAERLGLAPGDRLRLSVAGIASARPAAGSSAHFSCAVTGLVASGKAEDEQAFVPLARLQKLAGLGGRVSLVEMRVPGPTRDVETAVKKFSSAFPSLEIRPLR